MKTRRAPWHKKHLSLTTGPMDYAKISPKFDCKQGQVTKEAESTGPVSHGLKLGSKGQKGPETWGSDLRTGTATFS